MKSLIKQEEQKQGVKRNYLVWEQVEKLAPIAPILKFMAIEGVLQSKEKLQDINQVEVICKEHEALKIYPFSKFVTN